MGAYFSGSFPRIVLGHQVPAEKHLHLPLSSSSGGHAPVAQLNNAPTYKAFVY